SRARRSVATAAPSTASPTPESSPTLREPGADCRCLCGATGFSSEPACSLIQRASSNSACTPITGAGIGVKFFATRCVSRLVRRDVRGALLVRAVDDVVEDIGGGGVQSGPSLFLGVRADRRWYRRDRRRGDFPADPGQPSERDGIKLP